MHYTDDIHISSFRGISPTDAYRCNTLYYILYEGRKMFFEYAHRKMLFVGRKMSGRYFELKTKPEIGFFFVENLPLSLAVQANIGLSILLVAMQQQNNSLAKILRNYLDSLGDQPHLKAIAEIIVKAIDINLLQFQLMQLEEVSSEVEHYRVVASSSIDLRRVVTMEDLVHISIIFSDLIPWEKLNLHPFKYQLIRSMVEVKLKYKRRILQHPEDDMYQICEDWVRECVEILAPDLTRIITQPLGKPTAQCISNIRYIHVEAVQNETGNVYLSTADLSNADLPILGGLTQDARVNAHKLIDKGELEALAKSCLAASKQHVPQSPNLDIFDLKPFQKTSLEGDFIAQQKVTTEIRGKQVSGEIQVNLVTPSPDFSSVEILAEKCGVIRNAFHSMKYSNIEKELYRKNTKSGYEIHPNKLPVFQVSDHLFLRSECREKERQGKPLLVILYDGSGSMNGLEFELAKILVAGISAAAMDLDLVLRAAVYGNNGHPVLDYLCHEDLVASQDVHEITARIHHSRCYGGQEDALSILHILKEAANKYQGKRTCYFILITDEGYGKSFALQGCNPTEEVQEVINKCRQEIWKDQLHTTLISFRSIPSDLVDTVDKVIYLKKEHLQQMDAVCQRIGQYIASCISDFHNRKMIKA